MLATGKTSTETARSVLKSSFMITSGGVLSAYLDLHSRITPVTSCSSSSVAERWLVDALPVDVPAEICLRALDIGADRLADGREDVGRTELLEQTRAAKHAAHRRVG